MSQRENEKRLPQPIIASPDDSVWNRRRNSSERGSGGGGEDSSGSSENSNNNNTSFNSPSTFLVHPPTIDTSSPSVVPMTSPSNVKGVGIVVGPTSSPIIAPSPSSHNSSFTNSGGLNSNHMMSLNGDMNSNNNNNNSGGLNGRAMLHTTTSASSSSSSLLETPRGSSQRHSSEKVLLELKSPTVSIVEFLIKVRRGQNLSSSDMEEASVLLDRLYAMRSHWANPSLEALNEDGEQVDDELRQFLSDTLANPAEQLPGAAPVPSSTRRSIRLTQSAMHEAGLAAPPRANSFGREDGDRFGSVILGSGGGLSSHKGEKSPGWMTPGSSTESNSGGGGGGGGGGMGSGSFTGEKSSSSSNKGEGGNWGTAGSSTSLDGFAKSTERIVVSDDSRQDAVLKQELLQQEKHKQELKLQQEILAQQIKEQQQQLILQRQQLEQQQQLQAAVAAAAAAVQSSQSLAATPIPTEFSGRALRALELGSSWDQYDAYELDAATGGHCLSALGVWLFQTYHFQEQFGLDMVKVSRAFQRFESLYHDNNPYHNRWHATDVLQCCHYMLSYCGIAPFFTPLEQMAILLAALVHDLDHPGTNNAFQVATNSTLGLRYNDRSVLENHHVALAFGTIWGCDKAREELDFLSVLTKDERQNVRKMVIEMVLATDLAVNLDIVNLFKMELGHGKFDALIDGVRQGTELEECCTVEDRILLMKMIVKCADISHVARPLHYHLTWTANVTKEFYEQGDRERNLGLPVAPFMDRFLGGLAKGQAGFLQFVAKPMWILLEPFMSNRILLDRLESNLEHWHTEARRDAEAATLRSSETPASGTSVSLLSPSGSSSNINMNSNSNNSHNNTATGNNSNSNTNSPLHSFPPTTSSSAASSPVPPTATTTTSVAAAASSQ